MESNSCCSGLFATNSPVEGRTEFTSWFDITCTVLTIADASAAVTFASVDGVVRVHHMTATARLATARLVAHPAKFALAPARDLFSGELRLGVTLALRISSRMRFSNPADTSTGDASAARRRAPSSA